MTNLFSPLQIKDITLRNRIAMSPMCQYSATDGLMNDWHLVHLGGRAVGGAALIIVEAAAVSPDARATPEDIGIWNDAQAAACEPSVAFMKRHGAVPGIQLQHAGRMGGLQSPWNGNNYYPEGDVNAWPAVGPSALPIGGPYQRMPRELTVAEIKQIQSEFAQSAARARDAGFQWLELHYGHSYLFQNFFSPIANKRTDEYGGSAENRARMLLETLDAVRAEWPERLPMSIRLGVKDFAPGEQPFEESLALIREFKAHGLDMIDVTLGFNGADSDIPWGKGAFMTATAGEIRRETGLLTATSWNISDPQQADALITSGEVDLVMLGRAMLADPYWPYHAAQALRQDNPPGQLPQQYSVWLHGREVITPTA
jgi:2,4-dienoyl-CoA reductase-like NADH-dependent reductase (Old Yellow Enzyme family)